MDYAKASLFSCHALSFIVDSVSIVFASFIHLNTVLNNFEKKAWIQFNDDGDDCIEEIVSLRLYSNEKIW